VHVLLHIINISIVTIVDEKKDVSVLKQWNPFLFEKISKKGGLRKSYK